MNQLIVNPLSPFHYNTNRFSRLSYLNMIRSQTLCEDLTPAGQADRQAISRQRTETLKGSKTHERLKTTLILPQASQHQTDISYVK